MDKDSPRFDFLGVGWVRANRRNLDFVVKRWRGECGFVGTRRIFFVAIAAKLSSSSSTICVDEKQNEATEALSALQLYGRALVQILTVVIKQVEGRVLKSRHQQSWSILAAKTNGLFSLPNQCQIGIDVEISCRRVQSYLLPADQ